MNVLPRWMRGYGGRNIRPDVIAGLSLAAFAIPESLAYASLADLPPISGLYCYLVAGIAYALFGTSRQLAVGPTSALAIAVAASIAALGGGDTARVVALGSGIALLVGLIAVGGRYLGLANVAYFLPDTVITGFKTGAAIYIASTQLPKLFGIQGGSGSFFERIAHIASSLPQTHTPSLVVGVGAIVLFLVLERLLPGRPTTLLVVAAAIIATKFLGLDRFGIHIVGELPTGLPAVGPPNLSFKDFVDLIPTALACFMLAYGESISVARSFAQKHGYEIDPERELTAIGMANLATGLARGFPVGGGMSQTAINDMGGATSPLSLIVTSGAIALTLLFFAGLFHDLPEPVLGAIVLMAAKHLVKLEELKVVRTASRIEFRIASLALLGVLVFGLLDGLLMAALGSLVVLIARVARPPVVVLARDSSGRFVNRERLSQPVDTPGALVLRSGSAWVYFNAEYMRRQILDLVDRAVDPVRAVIIDCSMVPAIDLNAAGSLRALARTLSASGIGLHLAELRDDIAESLRVSGAGADLESIVSHQTVEDSLTRAARSLG